MADEVIGELVKLMYCDVADDVSNVTVTEVAREAFVAFVTAVAPIWPTMSAALAT